MTVVASVAARVIDVATRVESHSLDAETSGSEDGAITALDRALYDLVETNDGLKD